MAQMPQENNRGPLMPSGRHQNDASIDHYKNLVNEIDDQELMRQAEHILEIWELDQKSREDWLMMAEKGMEVLSPNGGVTSENEEDAQKGLTDLKSPALIQAQTQFASSMHAEMIPLDGPADIKVEGPNVSQMVEGGEEKLRKWMNHVLIDTTKYNKVMDRMLHILPLTGQVIHRITNDVLRRKPKFTTVMPKDFCVNPEAMDLQTASRIFWCYDISLNEYNKLVEKDWYAPIKNPGHIDQDTIDLSEENSTGIRDTTENLKFRNDMQIKLLECHMNIDFSGLDGMEDDNLDKVVPPYIVTIDTGSRQIVSVRRNWEMNDPIKQKIEHFVDYQFYPTSKFYGIGLYHICGSMHRLATAITRSGIDWAYIRNMPGGFYLQGALAEGVSPETVQMKTGEYAPINAVGNDIREVLMPNPVSPSDNSLMEFLDYALQMIKEVAGINDVDMGSVSAQTPAATTAMMVQRAEQRAKGIQKRLWESQSRELAIVKRIMLENVQYDVTLPIDGEIISIARGEIEGITFIPTADPASSSKRERAANFQALLEIHGALGTLDPQKLTEKALRNYDIDPEEVMAGEEQTPSFDPVTEFERVTQGMPIEVEITDDHQSHIDVMMMDLENPTKLAILQQSETLPVYAAHLYKHHSYQIKTELIQMMQQQMGREVPMDIFFNELEPDQKNWLAMATANIMSRNPEMGRVPGIEALAQDPMMEQELQHAKQMNELEMQAKVEDIEGKREALAIKSQESRIKIQEKTASANIQERINAEKLLEIREQADIRVKEAVRKAQVAAQDRQDELQAKIAERDLRIEEAQIRIKELEAKLRAEEKKIRLIPKRGGSE